MVDMAVSKESGSCCQTHGNESEEDGVVIAKALPKFSSNQRGSHVGESTTCGQIEILGLCESVDLFGKEVEVLKKETHCEGMNTFECEDHRLGGAHLWFSFQKGA